MHNVNMLTTQYAATSSKGKAVFRRLVPISGALFRFYGTWAYLGCFIYVFRLSISWEFANELKVLVFTFVISI